jgi:hypothetical protein
MSINRYRGLLYNPLFQLGVGGLLGGLSGQQPAQAFFGTGAKAMQLGQNLRSADALRQLSQNPNLTDLEKQLVTIAPTEVIKSMLKRRETKATRLLTEQEKKDEGFNLKDVVQINAKGERKVLKSIPAGEAAKAATRKTVLSSIDKIVRDVDKFGTGFFEGRLKGLTTPFNKGQAKFRADTKQLELNVIKALRGAQVSAAEEDNVRKILPQVTDSETMYKAKAQSLREYLQELDARIDGEVVTGESKILNKEIDRVEKEKNKGSLTIGEDGVFDATIG